MIVLLYSAVHSFWLMKVLEELVDGPTGCGEGWVFICLELQCDKAQCT